MASEGFQSLEQRGEGLKSLERNGAEQTRSLQPNARQPATSVERIMTPFAALDRAPTIAAIGSPSDTASVTLDILERAEGQRLRGQLVFFRLPVDGKPIAVLGQIANVTTTNRWHEDHSFRGVIKRAGSLPHLSGRADIRTANLTVQAAFGLGENGDVSEEMLSTSPATGTPVCTVDDDVLAALLSRHADETVTLGRVFGTPVKMPFTLRHFGRGAGGAGEAYHIGVFGKTGSGKSGFAAYMLLAYARHQSMGLIVIDPQGQFSNDRDLPFGLHRALRAVGRDVRVYRMATQLRLGDNARQFAELLAKANFYRFLGIRNPENVEIAIEVLYAAVRRTLTESGARLDAAPRDLMERVLGQLADDPRALERIYTGRERREQLAERLRAVLGDAGERDELRALWLAALDLFSATDSRGNVRTPLWGVVAAAIGAGGAEGGQPVTFLDISGEGTAFKDDEEIKALLLKEIASALDIEGGKAFAAGQRLNCLVTLDEAHRYVKSFARGDDSSEMAQLTKRFVDAVRTTRKYGLGYLFVTQTLASLHREIVGQLRLCAFGYGLTMGSELSQLQELVGDKDALSLYRSFVDPQSRREYPFLVTGPASPLSFTGAPLFVEMFNRFEDFGAANAWFDASAAIAPPPAPPESRFESPEAYNSARKSDFD